MSRKEYNVPHSVVTLTTSQSSQIDTSRSLLRIFTLFFVLLSLCSTSVKGNIVHNTNTTHEISSAQYRRRLYSTNQVFNFAASGQPSTFVVPNGVTSIYVEATGAASGTGSGGPQGLGAKVTSTLTVIPGTTLYIYIGGKGINYGGESSPLGGFNGGGNGASGGGGGGATDIRDGTGLNNRMLVAAGGGGPYGACSPSNGGNGGTPNGVSGNPGSCNAESGSAGGGATQTAGGTNTLCGTSCAGTLGQGGNGVTGGGGGGGYYGGAGGQYGGSGGGGSSYSKGTGTTYTTSANVGDGSLTIFYDLPQPTPLPTVMPSSRMPSRQPSVLPSMQPTLQPSYPPTRQPSRQPSVLPSEQPTLQPSYQPTRQPSRQPSVLPSEQPTLQPSYQPTRQPSVLPSEQPSYQPTRQPSRQPSVQPSMQPTVQPSYQPTGQPSQRPLTQPTGRPSGQPSGQPSQQPNVRPSCLPTGRPSQRPLAQPTAVPTDQSIASPSSPPSSVPSALPSMQPSSVPTDQPSCLPSEQPSIQPSGLPTCRPSSVPSKNPRAFPSAQPSGRPTAVPLAHPSAQPSRRPTAVPSAHPSSQPSGQPSAVPSAHPSAPPSGQPSAVPSAHPSCEPSGQPSAQPTAVPSAHPSSEPSGQPSAVPSAHPSAQPSGQPSAVPSAHPSSEPTGRPTAVPSAHPSSQPSGQPSAVPSAHPSCEPSGQPSAVPSAHPSSEPSGKPSAFPSAHPSCEPSGQPSAVPSAHPSIEPTGRPTSVPSVQPVSVPTCQPSLWPTTYPSVVPSCQPISAPSSLPSVEPSVQPSSDPSAQPSRQPSVQPTALPTTTTSVPTMPTSVQWRELYTKMQILIQSNRGSDVAHQSLYGELDVAGDTPYNVHGSCSSWSSVLTGDVEPSSYLYRANEIRLTVCQSLSAYSESISCLDATKAQQIIALLVNDVKTIHHIPCDGHNWTISNCSAHSLPSLCVDCSDPCSLSSHCSSSKDNAIASVPYVISPCVSTVCTESNTPASAIRIFSVDFKETEQAPVVLNFEAVSTKTSITVNVSLSGSGLVYCAAYRYFADQLSLNVIPGSLTEIMLQNNVASTKSDNVSSVLISGLNAVANYNVYCIAASPSNAMTPLATVLTNVHVVQTACCKSLDVKTASSSLTEGQVALNFISVLLSSAPSSQVVLTLTLYNSLTNAAVISSPHVPSEFVIESSTSGRSVSLMSSLSAMSEGTYYVKATLSGTLSSEFEVAYNGFPVSQLVFNVQSSDMALPAPMLKSAVFARDGTHVVISFDSRTDNGGTSTEFTCSQLFDFSCASASKCRWTDDGATLLVYIDTSAQCAKIDDTITLLASAVIKARCGLAISGCNTTSWAHTVAPSVLTIQANSEAISPMISMSAPSTLGQCAPLILDMSGSKGSGGRAWRDYHFIVTSSSERANASAIQKFLNTEYKMSPPTPIPWQLLSGGATYTFTATLCNFMKKCRQKSSKTLLLNSVLPTVILPGAPVRYVTRNSALTVNSNAYVMDCNDNKARSDMTYEWSVFANNVLLPFASASKDLSKLLLPAYTLTVGTLYTVSLTVTIASTSKASVASIQILVKQGNLVARVAGGTAHTVGMNAAVTFDASSSYDEDVNSMINDNSVGNLIYAWSCKQIAPTLRTSCSDIFQDSTHIVANHTTFAAHTKSTFIANYVAQITVTVSGKLSDRVSTSSITLTILPDGVPVVNVVALGVNNGVVNSGQVIQLQGKVVLSSGTAGVAEWNTSDSSLVNLNSVALSPLSVTVPSSSSAFDIFLALTGNSLPTGTMLTFSLLCRTLGNSSSTASVSFTVNGPPAPGTFEVAALPAVTGQLPQFTFFASNWEDMDTPLTYQFGYISNAGTRIVLVAKSEATYSTTSVPAGLASADYMVQCFADIADSSGANTTAVYSVRIQPVVNDGLSLVSSLLSEQSSSVNEFTQVTAIANGILNTVTCSSAPNCASLNRLPCAQTRNTCGTCKSEQYVGDAGDSNTKCVRASSVKNRRLSSTVLTCSDTSECTGFEECTDGQCVVPLKNCSSGCLNGGTCTFIHNDRRTPVSDCRVGDTSCTAVCECLLEYAGSYDCSLNSTELIARQSSRLLVLKNIASLMDLEDPDQQSVVAWINSLSEATQSPDELNDEALSLILSLSTSLMSYATEVRLGSNSVQLLLDSIDAATQASTNEHQRRRLTGEGITGNYTSTLSKTEGALKQFSDLVSQSMLPGQFPVKVVYSQFRSNIQVFAATGDASNVSMSVPLSDLEVLNGLKASSVSMPRSNDSASAVRMSVTSMLSSLYNTLDESLESNPVTVQMSALPSCATPPCRMEIELQFSQVLNHSRLNPNRPEMVRQSCRKGLNITYNHTCSDGYVLHLHCNGTAARVLNTQCPYTSYSPVCNTLMGSSVTDSDCIEISHTNTSITCSCLPEFYRRRLQSDNSSDGYSASYVSMLSAVESSFLTTVGRADDWDTNTLEAGWRAIVTIGTFAAAIVIALLWSNQADGTEKAKTKEQKEAKKKTVISSLKRTKQGDGKVTTTAATPRKAKAVRKGPVKNADLALIESALPNVLSSQTLSQRILAEVKLNHRWIGVVFFYSERFPRVLRVLSLATNIIIMLFIQSLTYTLTNPDDGSCELLTTQATCIEPKSPFATGESKCSWSDSECSFIQPSNSSRIILFVAIFSAIISTPIALVSDWIVRRILSASTKEWKDKTVPTGNATQPMDAASPLPPTTIRDRRVGLTITSQSNKLLAQSEVNELHTALVSYRESLSDTQKKEFDVVWGLDSVGQFLSPDGNNGATNDIWTRLQLFKQSVAKNPDVRQLLTDEISRVLASVKLESDSLQRSNASQKEIGRKLLFLFQCDLLPGISGQILHSKGQRDALSTKQVSLTAKICGWVFTFLLNAGMLFYILLFALGESEQRQGAWFKSFIMWLVVEILLVSTGVTLFTHIFIPLLTMKDVTKIKQRLLDSIQSFHESVAKKRLCAKGDQYQENDNEDVSPFNAADYLFVSTRVAKKYPELKEAQIIAQFSTPWPKQSYQHVNDVTKTYNKKYTALIRGLSIVAVFMLTSLLRIPPTLQDMVIQMVTTATVGYTILLHIDLFGIFPLLAFGPFIVMCIILHFFIQSQKSAAKQRLAKLFPTPVGTVDHQNDGKKQSHQSRRASTLQGINTAEEIRKAHAASRRDKLNMIREPAVLDDEEDFSIDLSEETRLSVVREGDCEDGDGDEDLSVDSAMFEEYYIQNGEVEVDICDDVDEGRLNTLQEMYATQLADSNGNNHCYENWVKGKEDINYF